MGLLGLYSAAIKAIHYLLEFTLGMGIGLPLSLCLHLPTQLRFSILQMKTPRKGKSPFKMDLFI